MFYLGRKAAQKKSATLDLRDPKAREEFLMSEMVKANQKIQEGKGLQEVEM